MAEIFISVNNSIDIDVKSGQFVINSNNDGQLVKIANVPSSVLATGEQVGEKISIKTAMTYIDDVLDVISPVLEYHGIGASLLGNEIVIDDAEYLEDDTVDAINLAVKGLNTYLK